MFSLSSVEKIYNLFNFELIDAIPQETHGGSMRYIIKRKNIAKKSKRLIKLIANERKKNVDKFSGCISFKKQVEKGFIYDSGQNSFFLSIKQIRELIKLNINDKFVPF